VMISSRTKAALAAAKARGTRLGNPTSQIGRRACEGARASVSVRKARAAKRSADLLPIVHAIQAEGANSLRQIAGILNTRGIPAPRGGAWSAVQVRRILAG
jgi:DNA invertase Pin-like site-specific DNA recombinase